MGTVGFIISVFTGGVFVQEGLLQVYLHNTIIINALKVRMLFVLNMAPIFYDFNNSFI